MATTNTWNDPKSCPFCGESIPSAGAGFIDHVDEREDCRTEFETWRDRVTQDVSGCWAG